MIILYRFLLGIMCYASTLHATDLYDPDLNTGDIASDSNDGVDDTDTESADETDDTPNEAESDDSGDADLGSLAKSAENLLKGSDDDTESAVDSMKKNISALAEREAR
jgi:hypothetical protein